MRRLLSSSLTRAVYVLMLLATPSTAQLTPAAAAEQDVYPQLDTRPPHDWVELRQGDVVAFLGGESAVLEGERGHLESLILASHPDLGLRFRNLAWEGDTVFEQPRDVNFPDLIEQLRRAKAAVVICRFGRSEALSGPASLERFVRAYEALCARLSELPVRIMLITPNVFAKPTDPLLPDLTAHNVEVHQYANAIVELARRRGVPCVTMGDPRVGSNPRPVTQNGVSLTALEGAREAIEIARAFKVDPLKWRLQADDAGAWYVPELESLRQSIVAKNKLWFDYTRPMNWAFLGGDRVQVAASHDHRDSNVRWFPGEMEKFVPLIEAADRTVDEAARRAAETLRRR